MPARPRPTPAPPPVAIAWSALVDHLEDPHHSRIVADAIAKEAARRGLTGVKVRGFGAPAVLRAPELAHAIGGVCAWVLGLLSPWLGLGLALALIASLLHRRSGGSGLGEGLPRVPAWFVMLRPPGKVTRRVLAGVLDRAPPRRLELELTAGALAALILAMALGAPAWVGPLPVLAAGLWSLSAVWRAGRADPAATVDTLIDASIALGERDDVVVILSMKTAESGRGVAAMIDWYGLRGVDVLLVNGPMAVAPLARAGVPTSEVPARLDAVKAALGMPT